jgi:hypothetical protein
MAVCKLQNLTLLLMLLLLKLLVYAHPSLLLFLKTTKSAKAESYS